MADIENADEKLVEVHVNLPNHRMIGGESFWAKPLGKNLYRIENIPFCAYGLNLKDEVEAHLDEDEILEISKVVSRSGNRTFRVMFHDSNFEAQDKYIEQIRQMNCSLERWNETYLAVNAGNGADLDRIFDTLEQWENEDILGFETAHERVKGSFDDAPDGH